MGSWDEGPRQNDTALDYELDIFGHDGEDIESLDPDKMRYVAWLVTQLKSDFLDLKGHAGRSLDRMKALLCNTDWLGRWKEPNKVIDSIANQIKELENIVKGG